MSLFDVSNVSNPMQMAKFTIGDRGTDSHILYDHKALLFDKEKNLLVIPVCARGKLTQVLMDNPSGRAHTSST